ncbi:MAG: ATP-NAD kinase family protein [Halioglobus sp.]
MTGTLNIGLIINPLAGLGGKLARKGSDGEALRELVASLPEEETRRAAERVARALGSLQAVANCLQFFTWGGTMGADLLQSLHFSAKVLGEPKSGLSTSQDTRAAASSLRDAGVDLLLFAGGDGTARDVLDAVGEQLPVLGIPAGVKMHSGVFALSPEAAGELLLQLVNGGLVGLQRAEVRDIDEAAFRENVVRSRFYGELLVPAENRYLQHTKTGGREDASLVAADIAAWFSETLQPGRTYLLGPGSTTASVAAELGLQKTLLGVDVLRDGSLIARDVDEQQLLALLADRTDSAEIIVTAIGGQGHVFGRGNQQLSPDVIRAVGVDNIRIVAARSKIAALEGRPLLVDTNDAELDRALQGLHPVITGYDDHILYRVGEPWAD